MQAIEITFSELWRGFMATCPDLPDSSVLHRVAPQDQADQAFPYLAFIPSIGAGKHPQTAHLTVRLQLAVRLLTAESEAQGEAWLQAIRARIADRAALVTYIQALPELTRTGWRLLALATPNAVGVHVAKDEPTKHWDVEVHHEVQVR